MEFVDPIKDLETINEIKKLLKQKSQRDFLLFVFGINTGIRLNDLLHLKVKDVWDGKEAREFLFITEAGKRKEQSIFLNNKVHDASKGYLLDSNLSANDFLFKSRKYDGPITRQQAYRIINQAGREVGIQGKIGTHTIRKTFGYHAYRKGIAISLIQSVFGHASPSETLRYIGIDKKSKHLIKVDVHL
ncbi:tyrosine-type recombinase/integrase [Oceanobacillus halophilus]|uniref:Site-specific integrase n=1 Tax=Oceanobacillus halophilus TaxID=930130 RepID=A0A494ZT50_9BACI|nr:tyrosine-type recombinase/integrase [Oceanobacillus halophilus]RKQ29288.1 site-specific integrase [Oceanobacillus halophilus]